MLWANFEFNFIVIFFIIIITINPSRRVLTYNILTESYNIKNIFLLAKYHMIQFLL